MAYQALYRKYRPKTFNDVVGQEVIVNILKNAINSNKISHAYLFSGPRGTGKTTIAKIFAKVVNCDNHIDGISCEKCKSCLSINNNEDTDIIEIDAASNNGVEEIREIRSKVNLVPAELKYKVYIIDEVHMLSIGAFNALLKTLEEPPSHVIFILATTDPHKVPVTIISRCQCFEFKRINENKIVERLQEISKKENIQVEEDVLRKIAKISDGGMRDALSLLDKTSSYVSNDNISLELFNQVNGLVNGDIRDEFLDHIYNKNIIDIINMIEKIYNDGQDFVIFAQELMDDLREYMIDYYINREEKYNIDFVLSLIKSLNQLLINLKTVNNIRVMFETSILAFMDQNRNIEKENAQSSVKKSDSSELKEKIVDKVLEDKTISTENNNSIATNIPLVKIDYTTRFKIVNNTFATAQKNLKIAMTEKWSQLNDFVLDKSYGAAACFLVDSRLMAVGESEIIIVCEYDSVLERGLNLLPVMEELLFKLFDKKYMIAILTNSEWETEKKKFIDLKNQGKKYEYIDIQSEVEVNTSSDLDISDGDDTVKKAISLFGKDIVKIK